MTPPHVQDLAMRSLLGRCAHQPVSEDELVVGDWVEENINTKPELLAQLLEDIRAKVPLKDYGGGDLEAEVKAADRTTRVALAWLAGARLCEECWWPHTLEEVCWEMSTNNRQQNESRPFTPSRLSIAHRLHQLTGNGGGRRRLLVDLRTTAHVSDVVVAIRYRDHAPVPDRVRRAIEHELRDLMPAGVRWWVSTPAPENQP